MKNKSSQQSSSRGVQSTSRPRKEAEKVQVHKKHSPKIAHQSMRASGGGSRSAKSCLTDDELIQLWGVMRQKKLSRDERLSYIEKVLPYFQNRVPDLARKPLSVRIMCFILRHGTQMQSHVVISGLQTHLTDLASDIYGSKLVRRLMLRFKWDPQTARSALAELLPHVNQLCLNAISSSVISTAFQVFPNDLQNKMLSGLIGPAALVDAESVSKCGTVLRAASAIPGRKNFLLESCMSILSRAESKDLLGNTLLTKLAIDVFDVFFEDPSVLPAESQLKFISELTDGLTAENQLLSLVDTVDGVTLACFIIQFASPKQRKQIIKTFKSKIVELAADPFASICIWKLFSVIDDTVSITESLILGDSGIVGHVGPLLCTRAGSRLIYGLIGGIEELDHNGTSPLLAPWTIAILKRTNLSAICNCATNSIFPGLSKKDMPLRQTELARSVLPPVLNTLAVYSNAIESLLTTPEPASQILVVICKAGLSQENLQGTVTRVFGRIAEVACSPVSESKTTNSTSDNPHQAGRKGRFVEAKETTLEDSDESSNSAETAPSADVHTAEVLLFRDNVGYYSVRRLLKELGKCFAELLFNRIKTVAVNQLDNRRGAFMLEHIGAAWPENLSALRTFCEKSGIQKSLQPDKDAGAKALVKLLA